MDGTPGVIEELLGAGHLDPASCLSEAFSVEERSSRNRLELVRTAARTLVVKHYASARGQAREVAALEALAGRRLAFSAPEILARDEGRLVLSSLPGLIGVHERWRARRPSPHEAGRVGRALASLQTVDPPVGTPWSELPFDPWAAGPELLDASAAAKEVVRRVQEDDLRREHADLVTRLQDEPRVFCHGDVRTQNVLRATSSPEFVLIDWETACAAKPSLDIGAGLAMFVELALTDGRGVPDAPAMLAYLAAWEGCSWDLDLYVVLRCAGLRLLQTAVEYASASHDVPEVAHRLCRVGTLLVRRPSEGAVHLRLLS